MTVIVEHGDRWVNSLGSDLDLAPATQIQDLPGSSFVAREIGRCVPFLTNKGARLWLQPGPLFLAEMRQVDYGIKTVSMT